MPDTDENQQKIDKLALEVLKLSRNTLLVNLRFLDAALSQFEPVPFEGSYATNGHYLFYDPRHILKSYRSEREAPTRDYLHIVMHCIFQHMYGAPNLQRDIWDLACDIAVEYTISELDLKSTSAKRERLQTDFFAKLKKEISHLTAEKIYRFLREKKLSKKELAELRGLFYADNHEIWYMTAEQVAALAGDSPVQGSGKGSGSDSDGDGNVDGGDPDGNTSENSGSLSRSAQAQIWKDIAERMQVDMETFSKQRGDQAGSLMQNLREVNREKYDYSAFLRKFAVRTEVMKVNNDEFDYIFYTYGLHLYKRVPLIEPLEYKDEKRIREFVIAIDTSGSTSGELVQKFVQKTYNILKSTETFTSRINLHIIQCDADIQEDAKITSQEEFDAYLKTMKIRGLGGTDFRPVFSYVDELQKNKEFANLRGLIYFTDGYGVFPAKKPAYETVFVFIDDEDNNPDVPSWAIKLLLKRDEI